ncbi:MAG: DinB family protein [Clostridia bacterium]
MVILFHYNWQVRDQWFDWCSKLDEKELIRERVGGVGSILRTLYHIVDVEQSWLRALQGIPDYPDDFPAYATLSKIKELSAACRPNLQEFLFDWTAEMDRRIYSGIHPVTKEPFSYRFGEVIRHVIAHEIHHIGQLSVWARELGLEPISPNVIGRNLYPPNC